LEQPLTEAIINYPLLQCLDNLFGQKPLGLENLKYKQLEDEVKEMVLEPVYLTEKLRYIIQIFGSIVSAC
jgi:hypothetical protein